MRTICALKRILVQYTKYIRTLSSRQVLDVLIVGPSALSLSSLMRNKAYTHTYIYICIYKHINPFDAHHNVVYMVVKSSFASISIVHGFLTSSNQTHTDRQKRTQLQDDSSCSRVHACP